MRPLTRRVLQALLYELGAIALTAPLIGVGFETSTSSALALSMMMSTTALTWNYGFNALFERWEATQATRGRSFKRRVAHGLGFEGGLALLLVPMMAWWLDTSLWTALVAELGFLLLFFVYAVAFTWGFDKVFGLPASALKGAGLGAEPPRP